MRARRFAVLAGLAAVLAMAAVPAMAEVIHLEIEDYKAGAEVGFHDTTAGNSGNQYRTAPGDDVDVEWVSDIGGGYNVGWTNDGEWMYLTVDPGTWTTDPTFVGGQAYYVYARLSINGDGKACSVDVGNGAAGITFNPLPNTNGWQNWTTVSGTTDNAVPAGQQPVKFVCDTGGFNVNWIELSTAPLDTTTNPIPQKLDPVTGYYYEAHGSFTWDGARVDAETDAPTFQGATGEWVTLTSHAQAKGLAPLGDTWIPLTDSTATSDLDGWDASTLGTAEGGDESGLPYPADTTGDGVPDSVPVSGERGYGWKWLDGTPLLYQNWNGSEPNDWTDATSNPDGENAAQLTGGGGWNDHKAGATLGDQNDNYLPYLVRYETVLQQYMFEVTERSASSTFSGNGLVESLAEAAALLDSTDPNDYDGEAIVQAYAVCFQDPEAGGGIGRSVRAPFYLDTPGTDDQDFAFRATADVEIPDGGGIYTFAVSHDDHVRLTVDGQVFEAGGPVGTELWVVDFATGGPKPLDLLFYERAGGAYVQLWAAMGDWNYFDEDRFFLVGDELGGGLALAPEPATLALVGSGVVLTLLARRRRR